MSDCGWEKIESFSSPSEFKRFARWIESQRDRGLCEELLVEGSHHEWADRKFRCKSSSEVWVLRLPDAGYFAGSWSPII